MIKYTQTIRRHLPTNCLSVFDHFVELALKGAISVLRQLLATESPLKMMKNTFYFTSKALSVLKIFELLS